jgi:hypothetical protein
VRCWYRTAISRNVIPFALVDPPVVLLPVMPNSVEKAKGSFKVLTAEQLLEAGFRYASAWFLEAEKRWNKKKTDKNKDMKTTLALILIGRQS